MPIRVQSFVRRGRKRGAWMNKIREKLIELLETVVPQKELLCAGEVIVSTAKVADHLIANGVTVQEWTSVKEGLPKLIPCDAGTAYSEAVNVLTTGRKVLTAIWDGFDWICDAEFWDAEGEEITHWTPVLLPLPQLPKEE